MDTNYDLSRLCLFTGTVHYHRLNRKCLLTDGAKYLAEGAGAFWLMDAAATKPHRAKAQKGEAKAPEQMDLSTTN